MTKENIVPNQREEEQRALHSLLIGEGESGGAR